MKNEIAPSLMIEAIIERALFTRESNEYLLRTFYITAYIKQLLPQSKLSDQFARSVEQQIRLCFIRIITYTMYLIICSLVIVLIGLIYKWSVAKYKTFEERGVAHDMPKPLMGNLSIQEFLGSVPGLKKQIDDHLRYRDSKVYGQYFLRDPVFVIRDPELIKNIGIKEFDHFMNHSGAQKVETLLTKSLVQLQDRKWKEMRHILTPTFTGSKMRTMYELINACSDVGVQFIEQEIQLEGGRSIELEMKDYFTRFTNDCIASAAFGIQIDSFAEKENTFFKIGQNVTNLKPIVIIKGLLYNILPKLMKVGVGTKI